MLGSILLYYCPLYKYFNNTMKSKKYETTIVQILN